MRESKKVIKRKKEEYRGIRYTLKLMEYRVDGKPHDYALCGKRWWVLEDCNTQKAVKTFVQSLKYREGLDSFIDGSLYEDTLHYGNRDQTLKQKEKAMRDAAKRDIDYLLSEDLQKKIEKRLKMLEALKTEAVRFKKKWNKKIKRVKK